MTNIKCSNNITIVKCLLIVQIIKCKFKTFELDKQKLGQILEILSCEKSVKKYLVALATFQLMPVMVNDHQTCQTALIKCQNLKLDSFFHMNILLTTREIHQ